MKTQQIPKPGQRIECVLMKFDQNPIPPGSRGTVLRVDKWGSETAHNVHVAWDSGRTLALCTDVDDYKVLSNEG